MVLEKFNIRKGEMVWEEEGTELDGCGWREEKGGRESRAHDKAGGVGKAY